MVKPRIIGIAGVARVGKDTFCDLLIKVLRQHGIESKRFAFADSLKSDTNSFLLAKTGVNAYTTCDKEKEIIRPLLVAYGELMRKLSDGQYWIDDIKKKIEKTQKNNTISIVSDVRYENEAQWINSTNRGLTLHLRRKGVNPVNHEESINDPLTKQACSRSLTWKTIDSPQLLLTHLLEHLYDTRILPESKRLRPNREYQKGCLQ